MANKLAVLFGTIAHKDKATASAHIQGRVISLKATIFVDCVGSSIRESLQLNLEQQFCQKRRRRGGCRTTTTPTKMTVKLDAPRYLTDRTNNGPVHPVSAPQPNGQTDSALTVMQAPRLECLTFDPFSLL
jgi:hypothetical protein